ncbi:MAG: AraC family transcriptional regulator, partial [Mucilaginibacter polytrichastri]|nr:AraC family transcriptional regulator [Mucilaginibacter polytrichastri]
MDIRRPLHADYSPLQPAFGQKDAVYYHEEKPHVLLQPYIWCYWELKTISALPEDYRYSVVADGCTDIFFSPDDLADATVAGFNPSHTEFVLGRQFRYLGVRFLPGMFTRLSGVAASELSQTVVLMSDVQPELSKRIAAGLNSDTDLPGITALFNDYFLRQ